MTEDKTLPSCLTTWLLWFLQECCSIFRQRLPEDEVATSGGMAQVTAMCSLDTLCFSTSDAGLDQEKASGE